MTTSPLSLQNIDEALALTGGTFTRLPKIAAPFTTIVNRAQCVDPANDHQPRFGISRVMTQQIQEVQGEGGPNGERVWKPINDQMDQVRFYGPWASGLTTAGSYVNDTIGGGVSYWEITFYGTGLNILIANTAGSAATLVAAVDGGSEGSNLIPTTISSVIASRNYAANNVVSVVSGLTQGTHTVKGRYTSGNTPPIFGFEILSTSSSLQYVPGSSYVGGRKVTKSALSTDTYNSNFESGSLGTKGGHVVVYQKADGTIKKAVQPTDASQLNLTSANHTNESVIRSYNPREFGAGRADDFSLLSTTQSDRAFTLDDGTTTLVGHNVQFDVIQAGGIGVPGSSGNLITFTFIGTGLDLDLWSDGSTRTIDQVFIDGTNVGSISNAANARVITKVCSGLAYGTHTVKLNSTGSAMPAIMKFITYGPVKPSIPSGAVELADYYVMGNYVATSSALVGVTASGILRKMMTREFLYSGTYGSLVLQVDANFDSGWNNSTNTAASYYQYTFFGTGFEIGTIVGAAAYNLTISVDGSSNLTGFTTGLLQPGSGLSLTASTGVISGTSSASGRFRVQVSGLSLGLHTIKLTFNSSGSSMYADTIDIITPIHSPKSNLPGDLQNTLLVGSNSLGDSRLLPAQTVKPLSNWAQAVGVTITPTTTSNVYVPLADMSVIVRTTGNPIQISYSIGLRNSSAGQGCQLQAYVNGSPVGVAKAIDSAAVSVTEILSDSLIVPLSAGTYVVQMYWLTGAGTMGSAGTGRSLTVREL